MDVGAGKDRPLESRGCGHAWAITRAVAAVYAGMGLAGISGALGLDKVKECVLMRVAG